MFLKNVSRKINQAHACKHLSPQIELQPLKITVICKMMSSVVISGLTCYALFCPSIFTMNFILILVYFVYNALSARILVRCTYVLVEMNISTTRVSLAFHINTYVSLHIPALFLSKAFTSSTKHIDHIE